MKIKLSVITMTFLEDCGIFSLFSLSAVLLNWRFGWIQYCIIIDIPSSIEQKYLILQTPNLDDNRYAYTETRRQLSQIDYESDSDGYNFCSDTEDE